MTIHKLSWERRIAGARQWQRVSFDFNWGVTVFEIQAMAAGLRAEKQNIRNVMVQEIKEVSRVIS